MSRFKNKFRFGLDRFQQTLYLVKYPSIGTIETNAGEKLQDGQLGGTTADKTLKMKKKDCVHCAAAGSPLFLYVPTWSGVKKKFQKTLILAFQVIVQPHKHKFCRRFSSLCSPFLAAFFDFCIEQ